MTFVAYDIELSETLSGTPNVLENCNNSNTLLNRILLQRSYTPIVLLQSQCTVEFLDNSHTSEPALMLQSRAAPSVGGNITAQWVLTRGEILEKGKKKMNVIVYTNFPVFFNFFLRTYIKIKIRHAKG